MDLEYYWANIQINEENVMRSLLSMLLQNRRHIIKWVIFQKLDVQKKRNGWFLGS